MRVTTEILGNEATVVVEDEGTGANAVRTDTVTVDDNGRLTYAAFEGKTIDFIKRYFRGDVDGTNIIGRNSTTLFSDGVLTVGTFLAGQSVNILQLGETFYTSDAKVFAEQSEQSAANSLTSANNAANSATNAQNAETGAVAARNEIVGKIPFAEFTDGSIPKWNNANQDFENQENWLEDVIEGDNVTIDKTDPKNPVINADNQLPLANEFDLLQQGATELESISREDLSKQKELILKSPSAPAGISNLIGWDNFNRADGSIGTADSGQNYSTITGSSLSISNNVAGTNLTGLNISAIPITAKPNDDWWIAKFTALNISVINQECGFVIGVDALNYISVELSVIDLKIKKCVAGVLTQVANTNLIAGLPLNNNFFRRINFEFVFKLYYQTAGFPGNSLIATVYLPITGTNINADLTSDFNVFEGNFTYAGLISRRDVYFMNDYKLFQKR